MASLASLKPSDTFDSLLHITGETAGLTTSLKAIEDGVGATSSLKLATTGQTIGASFNGRVGIGIDAPQAQLHISGSAEDTTQFILESTGASSANSCAVYS